LSRFTDHREGRREPRQAPGEKKFTRQNLRTTFFESIAH